MTPHPTLAITVPMLAALCLCAASSSAFARVASAVAGDRAASLSAAALPSDTPSSAAPSPDVPSSDASLPDMPSLAVSSPDESPLDIPSLDDPSSGAPSLGAALPLVPALLPTLVLDIERGPVALATAFSGQERDERERLVFGAFLHDTLNAALPDRRTEIAMPFAAIDYQSPDAHDHGYRYGHDGDYSLRRVDLQLRRFARDGRRGLYAGTLMRASWMDGTAYDPLTNDSGASGDGEVDEDRDDDLSRFGAGVVLGLRGQLRLRALPAQLYWGANLNVGRWLGGSPTRLAAELEPSRTTDRYFADVELAKIGMRF